jgi:hypothetical protein
MLHDLLECDDSNSIYSCTMHRFYLNSVLKNTIHSTSKHIWRMTWDSVLDCVWNVMAHSDTREEKWRGNNRMEWVTSKRHVTAEHRHAQAVQTLQDDVHSSPASSRSNWCPRRFKWTRPFCRMTKSGFCECAITFKTQSAINILQYKYDKDPPPQHPLK